MGKPHLVHVLSPGFVFLGDLEDLLSRWHKLSWSEQPGLKLNALALLHTGLSVWSALHGTVAGLLEECPKG